MDTFFLSVTQFPFYGDCVLNYVENCRKQNGEKWG